MTKISEFKNAVKRKQNGGIQAAMLHQKIENLLMEYEDKKQRFEGDRVGLHASAIIASENDFCLRAQVLSLFFKQNQGKQFPARTRKIFRMGNVIHEYLYDVFNETGVMIDSEQTRFVPEFDLAFTIDANLMLLGDEWICDVKSMNNFAFQKATSHPSGEKQVLFYEWLHRKKKGFVLCYNKDTCDIKIFVVPYNKEKVRPYVERLKQIQEYKKEFISSGKLPARKCKDCNTKKAKECFMRDACFRTGEGRRELAPEKRKEIQ